ncbi:DUF5320 family protein [archaeon]|nr:DUF5320 family protein [archaeon]
MPGYDRTGPRGRGPRTGRGLGPCGRGYRRGYRHSEPIELTKTEEKKILTEELKDLEEEKKEIEKRIKEIK